MEDEEMRGILSFMAVISLLVLMNFIVLAKHEVCIRDLERENAALRAETAAEDMRLGRMIQQNLCIMADGFAGQEQ